MRQTNLGPSDQLANCTESWATERPGLRLSHYPVATCGRQRQVIKKMLNC